MPACFFPFFRNLKDIFITYKNIFIEYLKGRTRHKKIKSFRGHFFVGSCKKKIIIEKKMVQANLFKVVLVNEQLSLSQHFQG